MSQSESPSPGLDPDEPHTPTWFTALGVLLFLFGGIFVLATGGEEPQAAELPQAEATADQAEPPAAPDQAEEVAE